MIAQNLLTAEETRQYRELGIADRLQSQRNRAYGQVAIAPTKPLPLLEPTQVSGPSSTGMGLGILNSGISMASGIAGAFAPSVGGDGGGTGGFPVPAPITESNQYNAMSNYGLIITYGNPRNSIPTWSGLV